MLSICRVGAGGEDYYLATAGSGRDHAEGLVEAAGVWLGEGAAQLGLSGDAHAGAVRRLLRGGDPSSGEALLDDPARRRIAAFDCTFSVPKSVSLLQAFSPDEAVCEQVRLGHEAAVRASLGYLEHEAVAVRVPGVDGPRRRRTPELVGVGFLHRLSRAGDPHLHTHVLVGNLVLERSAGTCRPLDATGLFLECRTAGALYETHLRHELTTRLGVEWQPLEGRCWSDLKGLDSAVIRAFSRRSTQIEEAMAAEGWQGPAARRAMAELTRPRKDVGRSYEETIEGARFRLWRAGVSEGRLREVCHRIGTPQQPRQPASTGSVPDEALRGARVRGPDAAWQEDTLRWLPARTVDGTFTLRDVIRARCAAAPSGRTVAGVQEDARALLTDERVLVRGAHAMRLRGGATGSIPLGGTEAVYTTREIVAAEDGLLRLARAMEAARPSSLMVIGYGPGKRFEALDALSAANAAWREHGHRVVATAPGRWAAAGIESSCGIDSIVVPALAPDSRWPSPTLGAPGRARSGVTIDPDSVVVVVDAHSYGPESLGAILRRCSEAAASVVLLVPARALEQRRLLGEVASIGRGQLPPQSRRLGRDGLEPATAEQHCFGLVEVTVVGSLGDARDEAVKCLLAVRAGRSPTGQSRQALLVAGDEAIVSALRAMPGVEPADVAHTRELKSLLSKRAERSAAPTHLVILGGASVLRQGATAAPDQRRSHIVVAPGMAASSREALGRAAEAARPRYLTSHLGAPPVALDERRAWRATAAVVEEYRHRWQIIDAASAFGPRSPASLRSPSRAGTDRAAELAAVERQAAEVRRPGRQRGGRERHPPDGLERGR